MDIFGTKARYVPGNQSDNPLKIMRSITKRLRSLKWKYILGEITLIVLGILIAVQINNWNESRKFRRFEKQIMQEIHQTFKKDLDVIKSRIRRCETIEKAAGKVYQQLGDRAPLSDELQRAFWLCNWVVFYHPQTIAFERLRAKGIEIVSDGQLRLDLLHLHDFLYPTVGSFTDRLNSWSETDLKPFAQTHFRIETESPTKKIYVPLDYQRLLDEPLFRNLILDKQSRTKDMQYHLSRIEEQLILLIDRIEKEYNFD